MSCRRSRRDVDAEHEAQPDVRLAAGDHLFAPAGEIHEGFAEENTTFFVVAPGGILQAK